MRERGWWGRANRAPVNTMRAAVVECGSGVIGGGGGGEGRRVWSATVTTRLPGWGNRSVAGDAVGKVRERPHRPSQAVRQQNRCCVTHQPNRLNGEAHGITHLNHIVLI